MSIYPGPTQIGKNSYTTPWRQSLGTVLNQIGNGTVTFQDASHDYLIQQVCVQVDDGTGGICIIEINNAFICGTSSGALDSADGNPAMTLRAGEILTITWAGVNTGTAAHATLIGQVVVYI